ncbi:MAG: hypothetical protein Kow0069_25640 [Promethearchaeota archaeon]
MREKKNLGYCPRCGRKMPETNPCCPDHQEFNDVQAEWRYCPTCGLSIKNQSRRCPKCGETYG